MKKAFILLAFLLGISINNQAQNLNLSNYIFHDMEPYIAVNPTNSFNVIAAWMKVTSVSEVTIAVSVSNDGGSSWSTPANMPHLYSGFTHADVSLSFNNSGKAYICYIDYATTQDSGYVMVASSTTGGTSWSAPVKVVSELETVDKPIDRPWIEVDRSSGPYSGRVYVVTKSVEGALPYHIWMKTSSDDGLTWSGMKLLDSVPTGNTVGSMGALTIGNDGTVYVGYLSYHTPSSPFLRALLIKSGNGGTSFTAPYTIGNFTGASAINDTLQGSITLSANPNNPNNLIFTYTDGMSGDADIKSRYSTNKGNTWTVGSKLNSDASGNGVEQDMSWAGFSPNGTYVAAWRDRRNTGTGVTDPFEMYVTTSTDGGATFSANYNLSTASSPDIPIQKGNDFVGVAVSNTNLHLAWCDNRTGNYEVFTNTTPLATLAVKEENHAKISTGKAYPNPASEEINIEFIVINEGNFSGALTDMNGKVLLPISEVHLMAGKHVKTFPLKYLKKGNYIIRLESATQEIVTTFVKE